MTMLLTGMIAIPRFARNDSLLLTELAGPVR
jgi:hypothetical protein